VLGPGLAPKRQYQGHELPSLADCRAAAGKALSQ
jgi:hypothetical protein